MKTFIFLTILTFTSSLFGAEIDTSAICNVYCSATTMIQGKPQTKYQLGTGFVYHEDQEDYFILTNSHTLDGTDKRPKVSFYKDERLTSLVDCTVNLNSFEDGTSNDVTVLSVSKSKIPYKIKPVNIKLESIEKDSLIFGAGYPAGLWLQQWKGLALSGTKKNIGLVNACPFGGQSGSPVFIDIDGENYAVGMLSYRFSKGVLPGQSMGGYIKMKYIHDIITNKPVTHEKVDISYTPVSTEYYVVVNGRNQIASYDIIDGEHIPKLYTEAEFGKAEIRPGDAFFPAESHPVCRGRIKYFLQRLGRGLPTINPPKELLPPFNKIAPSPTPTTPAQPDKKLWPDDTLKDISKPKEELPKESPKEESPKVAPEAPEEQFKQVEAEKPDLTIVELQKGLLDAQRQLEDAKKKYEQLTDESVKAERRLWEDKVSELNRKIEEIQKLLAEKNKPAPAPVPTEEKGFFKNLLGNIVALPGKAVSGISNLVGFSENGILWSIIGIAGPFLIPGVREFAVAKGVSPIVLNGAKYLLKFAGWLKKGKAGKDVVSNVIDEVKSKLDNNYTPVGFTPLPVDYNNVQLADYQIPAETIYKETSENNQNKVNDDASSAYNTTDSTMQNILNSVTPEQIKLPSSIKQLIDLKIQDGESLEWLIMNGNLYREGVIKLKNGELTDSRSAPIVGNKTIAAAVEKYVRDNYVRQVNYKTTQNEFAKDYITAYTGHLYKTAVKELAKGSLDTINHIEAAKSIEEYVVQKLYVELRNFN